MPSHKDQLTIRLTRTEKIALRKHAAARQQPVNEVIIKWLKPFLELLSRLPDEGK